MLIDGKYIRTNKPKIGAYYVPSMARKNQTPEEIFAQDIYLNINKGAKVNFITLISRLLKI
jgi:hypothetical protein